MTKEREIIKNWKIQKRVHYCLMSLVILWTLLIIACSYALFEKNFNQWVSTTGTFFLPFLITADALWIVIWLTQYLVTLRSVKSVLGKAYTSNRIRKADYEKLITLLEQAIENQGKFENDTQAILDKSKLEKNNAYVELFEKTKDKTVK